MNKLSNHFYDQSIKDTMSNLPTPNNFSKFIGQLTICSNLKIFINASQERQQALDHVLLFGPPGLGKTTLGQLIANELKAKFCATSGPVINKAGDLAGILTSIQNKGVLFIDEIHRLNRQVEEILYSAMDRFVLDIIIGEGTAARSVRIPLPRFTLIGATTRLGLLTKPLRDRFGIQCRLDYYTTKDLQQIILQVAQWLQVTITDDACLKLAEHARGTPRVAIRLLKRVRDFITIKQKNQKPMDRYINNELLKQVLQDMKIYHLGLDELDVSYLKCVVQKFNGGPVGLNTLAGVVSETEDSLQEIVEPYLIQQGLIQKTPQGRVMTDFGRHYVQSFL